MGTIKSKIFFAILCLFVFAAPARAVATVYVNEIAWMGTTVSANAEWIELYNSGTASVSLDGWTLTTQSGSLHGIFTNCTNKSIGAGGFYLLERTSDATVPGVTADCVYTGALVDSGDILTLSGSSIDIVDGSNSWLTIKGDKTTKRPAVRTAGGWTTADATPRAANINNIAAEQSGSPESDPSSQSNNSTIQTKNQAQSLSGLLAPEMEADAGDDRTVETGAGSFFDGHLYNGAGIPIPSGRYIWNFGNGETREGQNVFYAYPYPGTYVVVMTVDAGNGYATTDRITIESVPAEVELTELADGSLVVSNVTHAGKELDIGLWVLARGGNVFTIPKGTIILPNKAVRFASSLLNLPQGDAVLLYPSGLAAARAVRAGGAHVAGIEYLSAIRPVNEGLSVSPRSSAPASSAAGASIESEDPALPAGRSQVAAVAAATDASFPMSLPILGFVALVVLGAAGALFARRGYSPLEENDSPDSSHADPDDHAKEFSIREVKDSMED